MAKKCTHEELYVNKSMIFASSYFVYLCRIYRIWNVCMNEHFSLDKLKLLFINKSAKIEGQC
jgi:hypothetical protein